MHSKSGNVEIINYDKAVEVIEEFCESLLKRYQIGLKKLIVILSLILFIYCFTYVIK